MRTRVMASGAYRCLTCGAEWNEDGTNSVSKVKCPKCFSHKRAVPVSTIEPESEPETKPAQGASRISITDDTLEFTPPPSTGGEIPEPEPIDSDTQEAINDAKAEGGIAGLAAEMVKEGAVTPSELTEEECVDVVVAVYELEGLGLSAVGYESKPISDESGAPLPRAQRAGRALNRIFKRHPDLVKGGMADLLDGAIIIGILGAPVAGFGLSKLKERSERKKAEKKAANEKRNTAQAPAQTASTSLTFTIPENTESTAPIWAESGTVNIDETDR